jgi:hypothetical protein
MMWPPAAKAGSFVTKKKQGAGVSRPGGRWFQAFPGLHLRQMLLLDLVQHLSRFRSRWLKAIRSVSMDPQPSMKADISILLKPKILTLRLRD